jgi:hypothetical protein
MGRVKAAEKIREMIQPIRNRIALCTPIKFKEPRVRNYSFNGFW